MYYASFQRILHPKLQPAKILCDLAYGGIAAITFGFGFGFKNLPLP
jgi:hypothetical protein